MQQRIEKICQKMKQQGMDALLITSRENTRYLTGFSGSASYLLIGEKEVHFATDFRYIEVAKELCGAFCMVSMYKGEWTANLLERVDGLGISRLGVEDGSMSHRQYERLSSLPENVNLCSAQVLLDSARMVKDDWEILRIREAVRIAEDSFLEVLPLIRPGTTERDILAEMEYRMRKNGAEKAAFDTIVVSGERTSLPHGEATDRRFQIGDPITLDFGALYQGYCSDTTRTVFLGNPSEEMKTIYLLVRDAQKKAEDGVKVGATGKEVDRIARDAINARGYGKCFDHGLGHGVGILVHEEPRLSEKSETVLENNVVVTVEPGIYVEKLGGVRIENLVAVRGEQPMVFNRTSTELMIL